MLARIDSAWDGWTPYTMGRDGNRPGAILIHGDPYLGDKICQTTNYNTGQYFRFVLSFQDDISVDQAREIDEEFFDLLMVGFEEGEYHRDSVFHTDSDYKHIHTRIPKLNLATGTQLKVYNHKTDLKRLEAIKAYIVKKHNLKPTVKALVQNPKKKEKVIQQMRVWAGQEPFIFTKKGDRDREKMRLNDKVRESILAGLTRSLDDTKALFLEMGLKIANEGFDISKNEHYITLKNETGKVRVMGDIFGEEFYTNSPEKQKKSTKDNKPVAKEKSLDQLKKELDLLQKKRTSFISEQYKKSRARAKAKQEKLLAAAEQKAINNPIERSEDYEKITIPQQVKTGEADRRSADRAERTARRERRERSVAEAIALTEQAAAGTSERNEGYQGISVYNHRIVAAERRDRLRERRTQRIFGKILGQVLGEIREKIEGVFHKIEAYREPKIDSTLGQEEKSFPGPDDGIRSVL